MDKFEIEENDLLCSEGCLSCCAPLDLQEEIDAVVEKISQDESVAKG